MESHLAECPSCSAELDEFRQVSQLLKAAPLPEFLPRERFTANLALLLPRRPVQDRPVGKATFAWWLVPAGLLSLVLFVRTVFLVSTMVSLADLTGLLGSTAAWLGAGGQTFWFNTLMNLTGGQLGAAQASIAALNELGLLGHSVITSLFWQAGIFMFYCAWLAFWLKQNNRKLSLERVQLRHLNNGN
jgi:hypothetical protein